MKRFETLLCAWFSITLSACAGSSDPKGSQDPNDPEMSSGEGGQGGESSSLADCTDSSCDDGKFCNGVELCRPQSAEADADGCVAGQPPCGEGMCSNNEEECVEECPDNDGDGHAEESCGGDDCNDFDVDRYPGNEEVCDGAHDEDCDPNTLGPDKDKDGEVPVECCNPDGDGGLNCGLDCDDKSKEVNTEATEVCNGMDDDCDGIIDNGMLVPFYPDGDGDGYGDEDGEAVLACLSPVNYSPFPTDCDDGEPSRNPRNAESCDGLDNDCNGLLDAPDEDDDGDGFADSCAGLGPTETDCDDEVATTYPGAVELCNGVDDDCDGSPAAGDDFDGDGHAAEDAACIGGPLPLDDCDDTVPTTYPGAPELCNGVDDDCNTIEDDPGAICDVANADATCNAGACVIDECDDGFLDCDTLGSTGCEEDSTRSVDACGDCATQCGADEHCKGSTCKSDLRWVFQTDESIRGTAIAPDGGVFLLGEYDGASVTFGSHTATPCGGACAFGGYATYLDDTGTPVWVQAFAGLQSTELTYGAVHSSGDLITVGTFETDGMNITGTPFYNRGGRDAFLMRLDVVDGSPAWSRELGGSNNETIRDVHVIGDDIYVLIGTQSSVFRAGALGVVKQPDWPDFWHVLVKMSAVDGSIAWSKGLGVDAHFLDEVDGDVVMAGRFWAPSYTLDGLTITGTDCREICTVPPCHWFCPEDLLLARFSPDGTTKWLQSYSGEDQESLSSLGVRDAQILLTARYRGELGGTTFSEKQPITALFSAADGSVVSASALPAGFSSISSWTPGENPDWMLLRYDEGTPSFGGETFPDPLDSDDMVIAQIEPDGTQGWSFHIGGGHTWNYINGNLDTYEDRAIFAGTFYWDSLTVGGQVLSGSQSTYDNFVMSIEKN